MSREEFDALVTRLQTASERNPRAYNLRVVLLMLLGYGYLIGVLLGAILLTMGIVALAIGFPNALTIKLGLLLGIASGGLALALTKALWVRLDAPEGLELKLTDAPELFSLLDRLRRQFKGPRFHHILLTGDYNASVVQVPRLGVFGWQRNFLMVGLPLMQSLSPEEFEAVLAHEFGHLSANHSRFSGWIYRVRRSWEQAFEQMYKQQQGGTAILRKFLDWYWPKFNAHAFVLARASEYEADRCAAEFSGAPTIARALTRTNLHGALLEQKFWPGVYKRINTEPVPPANLFSEMGHTLRAPVDPIDSARWLKTSFTLETNNIDTHPCLKDRLRALNALPPDIHRGQFPVCIPPPASSAVHHFLGSNAGALTDKLNKTWASNVSSTWEQRRKEVEELNQELSKTDQGGDAPDAEKIWHKARALVDRDGDEAAMPVIKEVLLHDPEHAGALLVSGRYWLEKDNPAGVPLVERAIGSDEILTEAGCNLLYGFYSRTGQRDKLRELEHRVDKFHERLAADSQERNNVTPSDTFNLHGLGREVIDKMNKVFAEEKDVFTVSVARKQMRVFPKHPLLVFSVAVKVPWWKPRSSSANQKLVNRLVEKLPSEIPFLLFVAEQDLKALGKVIAAVPGSRIYERAPK